MVNNFTKQIDKKFNDRDFINSEREFNRKIENLEESDSESYYKELIDYLTDKKQEISLGFYLRRYICENYAVSHNEKTNIYTLKVKDLKGVIKSFDVQGFDEQDIDEEYLDEYAKFIKVLVKISNTKVKPSYMKNLLVASSCTRKVFFEKIAFSFEFEPDVCTLFLNNALAEKSFNFRDINEVIYYYCLKNKLKLDDANEILEKYKNNENKDDKERLHTSQISDEIDSIESTEELLKFLDENRESFSGYSNTVHKEFKELYDDVRVLVSIIEFTRKNKNRVYSIREDFKLGTKDLVEIYMLGKDDYSEEIKSESNVSSKSYKKRWEYISLKESKLKDVLFNILTRDKADYKYDCNAEITKKDIVFLNFYKYVVFLNDSDDIGEFKHDEIDDSTNEGRELKERVERLKEEASEIRNVRGKDEQEDDTYYGDKEWHKECVLNTLGDFKEETNTILGKCGMGKLYVPNKFDNLVIMCMVHRSPLEAFTTLLKKSLE